MTETTVPDVCPPTKLGADHGEPSVSRVGILIGYARCSTERQDLTAQREILRGLGVAEDRIYLDHGLTGRNRSRPGLNSALAAAPEGDTLVVPKLDRLARSVPDARAIGDSLAARGVRLSLGGSVYDPTDPMGKCFFNILATFAEFEVDLLRMRTREGMAIARAKGASKARPPNSARPSAQSCSSSTPPATTRSPNSPSSSQSAGPPSTVNSPATTRAAQTILTSQASGERSVLETVSVFRKGGQGVQLAAGWAAPEASR
jgi:DNA invertase Pin-like site-specific DNA recombinase